MPELHTQPSIKSDKPIRPAASLLIVRNGQEGIEVLTLKRSETMRFLPGFLAFPGGSLGKSDWDMSLWTGQIRSQRQTDDDAYALGAIRECAEEIGWLCAATGGDGTRALTIEEQETLLSEQIDFTHLLMQMDVQLDAAKLRFVGRWVTPSYMPARFDTRFFITLVPPGAISPQLAGTENEWAQWANPAELLEGITAGRLNAVPPTIAMLQGIRAFSSAEECFLRLEVPGPDDEDVSP